MGLKLCVFSFYCLIVLLGFFEIGAFADTPTPSGPVSISATFDSATDLNLFTLRSGTWSVTGREKCICTLLGQQISAPFVLY